MSAQKKSGLKFLSIQGQASSTDGIFSTRKGNATPWKQIANDLTRPIGQWQLSFKGGTPVEEQINRDLFQNEKIEDILFVITYIGRTPAWP